MAEKLHTPLNTSPGTIGTLALDLLMQEDEELANKVTQYPVEDGSAATDHVITEPDSLTIIGFVTNAPIRAHSGTVDSQARVTRQGQDQLVGTDINFAELAWEYLRKLRKSREPVTVSTKRGTWENLLVERISRSKTKSTGDALVFTIKLSEFRRVKLLFVDAPRKRTASQRSQPRADNGKKGTTKGTDDYASIGYNWVDGIFKTFFTKAP